MTSSSPSSSDSAAWELLHEGIQRWVWREKWDGLRPIQEQAVRPILGRERDVVIGAPTAGGKTEAAFLPIGSLLAEHDQPGIGCLCVSPLKALINDQYERLTSMLEGVRVPVTRWHGDVPAPAKKRLLQRPEGVLIITPESLEALFVRRGTMLPGLFAGLTHVVVDELHAFIGSERGRQLQSLLHRVDLAIRRRVPRIGLSATLGDMVAAAEVLRPGGGGDAAIIRDDDAPQDVLLQLRGLVRRRPADRKVPRSGGEVPASPQGGSAGAASIKGGSAVAELAEHLYAKLRGETNLIFANSRGLVEEVAVELRGLCEERGVPNEFLPHHGSLARELREEVETLLQDASRPTNVVCTSTLELGIDVGDVKSVAQVGSPPSVASMRQRLGRSGRRGGASIMRLYVIEEENTAKTAVQDTLRAELVQSMAMVRLLVDGWCEPPVLGDLHLSTLVQQVLSVLAQLGGAAAQDLFRALCSTGPFKGVDAKLFAALVRDMAGNDLVSQMHDGTLVLGRGGETLVDHYDFYAAFSSPEEYRIVTGGRPLGAIPITNPVAPGMYLVFAGRRWLVQDVDPQEKVIEVVAAHGGQAPVFSSGSAVVHDRVREEMRRLYLSTEVPAFLDARGRELLAEGRHWFDRWGLRESPFVETGGSVLVFPWMGDRVMNTLAVWLAAEGLAVTQHRVCLSVEKGRVEDLRELFVRLAGLPVPDPVDLARQVRNKATEKHHWALSDEVLSYDYASRYLDIGTASRVVHALAGLGTQEALSRGRERRGTVPPLPDRI